MTGILTRLTWWQRVVFWLIVAAGGAVLVVEAFSSPSVYGAVGLVVCGILPSVALFTRDLPARAVAGIGTLSIAFTVVCATVLPGHLDNTFGFFELIGLACLCVRTLLVFPAWRAAGLCLLLGLAATTLPLRLEDLDTAYTPLMSFIIAVVLAFVLLLGLVMRLYDRGRTDSFQLSRQAQRLEYARDLHDFVAHHVTAIVVQTQAVRFATGSGQLPDPAVLDKMLDGIERAGSQALTSMRTMVDVLRDDNAPMHPHQAITLMMNDLASSFTGAPVSTNIDPAIASLDLPTSTVDAARHVVQEALTNVLRHATRVSQVMVSARARGSEVEISVTNDGQAGDNGLPKGGFGLVGLAERVESAGGSLSAGPTGRGWAVTALLPSSTA
ncbi:histidine kinase [Lentzea sp. BCCO 10_0061]|uniref:histidine kinase n=1 Tax=Lentzea sokolovensis TaxID=3095429 RepID=A0ABU4V7M7_9PSEU|nr:histidine kinase [Lentzea sp. BCCO 10_0061]MDX8147229.1 histidine kinase [Lentzea sp. BCCO 10_0061]